MQGKWLVLVVLVMSCSSKTEEPPPPPVAAKVIPPAPKAIPVDAFVPDGNDPLAAARKERLTAKLKKLGGIKAEFKLDGAMVSVTDEPCDGIRLVKLRKQLIANGVDPSIDGFEKMDCDGGDEIDLRTKDGCTGNEEGQLILTEEGRRRNTYADAMTKVVLAAHGLATLLAMGCDATVLQIEVVGGCSVEALEELLPKVRSQLLPLGFKRIACGVDNTPSVDVR